MVRKKSGRRKRGGFEYRAHDKTDVRRSQSATSGVRDPMFNVQTDMFSPKPGEKYRIRVLPIPANVLGTDDRYVSFAYKIAVNYGIGPDNRAYLSRAEMLGEPDPIYEFRQVCLRRMDVEEAKNYRPTERYLMWIIDRKNQEKGPQLWACPKSAFRAMLDLMWDEDEGDDATLPIDHPDEGYDVVFSREAGEAQFSGYVNFKVTKRPLAISDDAAEQEEWLQFVMEHLLDGCLKFYDYDHIKDCFTGDFDEDEDGDKSDSKKSSKKKSKQITRAVDEDEDDDDEDEDDDEDDEDDDEDDEDQETLSVSRMKKKQSSKKSSKKKSKRVTKTVDEGDEEEDDEEEDDDDEVDVPAPRQKKKKSSKKKSKQITRAVDEDEDDDDEDEDDDEDDD